MFKIEKNVPIHNDAITANSGRGLVYPWNRMEDGDSFVVKVSGGIKEVNKRRNTVFASGRAYMKTHHPDNKIVTRREGKGFRVWVVRK